MARQILSQTVCREIGGVPDYFPQVSIGIAKISGIAPIECVLSRLDDFSSGACGLIHYFVNFFPAHNIVSDRESGGADRCLGHAAIVGDVVLGPDSEFQ